MSLTGYSQYCFEKCIRSSLKNMLINSLNPTPYHFLVLNALRCEEVLPFIDIGGIIYHHCLNFLFIIKYAERLIIIIIYIYICKKLILMPNY